MAGKSSPIEVRLHCFQNNSFSIWLSSSVSLFQKRIVYSFNSLKLASLSLNLSGAYKKCEYSKSPAKIDGSTLWNFLHCLLFFHILSWAYGMERKVQSGFWHFIAFEHLIKYTLFYIRILQESRDSNLVWTFSKDYKELEI